jgi:hypothetical protein
MCLCLFKIWNIPIAQDLRVAFKKVWIHSYKNATGFLNFAYSYVVWSSTARLKESDGKHATHLSNWTSCSVLLHLRLKFKFISCIEGHYIDCRKQLFWHHGVYWPNECMHRFWGTIKQESTDDLEKWHVLSYCLSYAKAEHFPCIVNCVPLFFTFYWEIWLMLKTGSVANPISKNFWNFSGICEPSH